MSKQPPRYEYKKGKWAMVLEKNKKRVKSGNPSPLYVPSNAPRYYCRFVGMKDGEQFWTVEELDSHEKLHDK